MYSQNQKGIRISKGSSDTAVAAGADWKGRGSKMPNRRDAIKAFKLSQPTA